MFSVIIVNEHKLFSDGLEKILNETDIFLVIKKNHNSTTLCNDLLYLDPHLIVLGIESSDSKSINLIPKIRRLRNKSKIVIISNHDNNVFSTESLRAGADGYFNKKVDSQLFVQSLKEIMEGGKSFQIRNVNKKEFRILTKKEIVILESISLGKTSQEIATQLGISLNTIKSHRKHMLRKLKAENSAELLRLAYENGII